MQKLGPGQSLFNSSERDVKLQHPHLSPCSVYNFSLLNSSGTPEYRRTLKGAIKLTEVS